MKKLDKILMMLNLFYTRKLVPMDTIQRVCGIPERTAYRYINTLSEADIPIYYDRDSRAYRLNRDECVEVGNLDINEQVLLVLALRIVSNTLPDAYRSDVDRLSRKMFSRLSLPMEEVWHALGRTLRETDLNQPQMGRMVTTAMVLAAMLANRRLRMVRRDDAESNSPCEIEEPSIVFGNSWCLVDRSRDGHQTPTAFEDIKRITID